MSNGVIRTALGSPGRTLVIAAMLCLACATAAPAPSAQQAQELTEELVNQRIAALRASGVPDDPIEAIYQQARAFLTQARANEQAAEAYTRALTTAPEQEDAIQARLDGMDDAYDPASELVGLGPEDLEVRLAVVRTQLNEVTSQLEATDRSLDARDASAATLEARLARLDQLMSALPITSPSIDSGGQPSAQEAEQWRNLAESRSLTAERRALQARLASQPARYSTMATARAEMAVNLERLEALLSLLESSVSSSDEAVEDPIQLGFVPGESAFQIAMDITDKQSALRDQRIDLNGRLQQARLQNQRIDDVSEAIDERFGTAQSIVEFAGGSKALGQVLLTYWDELRKFSLADPAVEVPQLVGDLVIERVKHEETHAALVRASAYLDSRMRDAGMDPETVSENTNDRLLMLIKSYREQLSSVISVQSEYLEALTNLDAGYKAFVGKLADYRAYLESMLLWIPNHPPLWLLSGAALVADYEHAGTRLASMRYTPAFGGGVLVVFVLLLLLGGRRLQAQQEVLNDRVSRQRDDSIRHTLGALALVTLRAAPAPLIVLAVTLGFDPTVSAEASALHRMFVRLAVLLFSLRLMRIVCEPHGIGLVHFHWPQTFVQRTNILLTSLTRWCLPLLVGAGIAHDLAPEGGEEAVGRVLLLVALLVLGYNVAAPQLREIRQSGRVWFKSNHNRLRALFTAVVLLTLYGTVVGQVFTVMVIIAVMINSFCIGVAIVLVHAVLVRWLRVARRRLQRSELIAQRQVQTGDEGVNVEESVPDIGDISAETQQLITFATIIVAAIAVLYVWAPLLPALEGLSRVSLWTSSTIIDGATIVNVITLKTLLTVVALAVVTLYAAKRLPALVELILRSRTSVTPGARYTISTVMNYIIVFSGVVAGSAALGLQWSELQWLIAALGVGIGFGLQEIVANFISGLIILFERPIRVGDIVTICDTDGVVVRIRIRATTIHDWDGKELLVPNKEFITGRLLNWTLSDSHTRMELPLGIAYGSNVEKALEILDDVVRKHPRVMRVPEPSVLFVGFGDNALNLVARCYVSKVEERMPVSSSLHIAINRAFEEAGIVISFPQRDIHFDTDKPLRIALDAPRPADGGP